MSETITRASHGKNDDGLQLLDDNGLQLSVSSLHHVPRNCRRFQKKLPRRHPHPPAALHLQALKTNREANPS
ncbi:hypothetical protein CEXT_468601 [Caerostris extrusa]|uniref:Uncharacterized protein n=1 Tax=Caerostris extrusa TaxID=172846 RepID=A0AAV4NXA9_CAEEX|nr:hypothetical protein CEXT_468601 [Caerostris extrusa]